MRPRLGTTTIAYSLIHDMDNHFSRKKKKFAYRFIVNSWRQLFNVHVIAIKQAQQRSPLADCIPYSIPVSFNNNIVHFHNHFVVFVGQLLLSSLIELSLEITQFIWFIIGIIIIINQMTSSVCFNLIDLKSNLIVIMKNLMQCSLYVITCKYVYLKKKTFNFKNRKSWKKNYNNEVIDQLVK